MNTNAASIRLLISSDESYYAPVYARAQEESRLLCKTFRDRPEWISGWAHLFACPQCAAQLTFDYSMDFNPPNVFRCPNCGNEVTGDVYDEAWVYFYRLYTSNMMESAAICALTGDQEALGFITRCFDFYAEHYANFPIHGFGNGKAMPQVLDECVWCIQLLRGYMPCRHLFSAEQKQRWYQQLFLPLAKLVNAPEIQTSIHNHIMWHKCAAGSVAVCFEDHELLDEVLNGTLGIREQAERGFTADGLWHEGSLTYHYYTLEALTGFCQFFAIDHANDPLIQLLEHAYLAVLKLSPDGWNIPSINDGWYPLSLNHFADQFYRAALLAHSDALRAKVEKILRLAPETTIPTGVLLLENAPAGVDVWQSSNLAIFHQPFHTILKSGVLVRSHKHRDNLSIVMQPFSRDLGTPGYGHPMYKGWYQLSASHNTIAVDGDQPPFVIPTHVEETATGVRAAVDSGWEGVVSASRTLTPDGDTLKDHTEVVCDAPRVIDWLFHADGDAAFSCPIGEAAELGKYPGYEYFSDVRRLESGPLTVSFTLNGRRLTLHADAGHLQAFTAKSPANPANELRTALILRANAESAVFDVAFTQTEL